MPNMVRLEPATLELTDRVVLDPEVTRITGLSNPTRWRMEQQGLFPKRIKVTKSRVGWRMSELQQWLANLPQVEASE